MRKYSNSLSGDRDACVVLRRSSLEDSLAERFSGGGSPRCCEVHARTVYRYAERFRVTGDVRRSTKRNGPTRLLSEHEELLLAQHILAHPGV